ncbi:MAG: Glucosylglycerate synthase [bacterium]|nr:Glucosylglycerate synthase [bacterium]
MNLSAMPVKLDEPLGLMAVDSTAAGASSLFRPWDGVFLPQELQKCLESIAEADVIVGIPSFNNARTIGHVVRAVQAGLAKYFPSQKCVLVNSDGGSQDGTAEIVQQTGIDNLATILVKHPQFPVHKIVTAYHGIPGKGSAFRTIFALAAQLGAKACCVVDSDLRSITPEWIELLLDPLLDSGFDFVAPLYQRHKFDGTITNSIIYPLTRALYGQRIRQPIGGDFGFSGRLAQHYLSKNVWDTDVARFGIDIWMTTTAIGDGFKVCQSYLGAKLHDAKDPSADLTSMFTQVVGSVFGLMEAHEKAWAPITGSREVPTFGFHYQVGLEPVRVNVDRMLENFRLGCRELGVVWKQILAPEHLAALVDLAAVAKEQFHFSDELWVQAVYDFVLAHHHRRLPYEHLLRSLIPLYLGRTAAFVLEMLESSAEEVEARIENLCRVYEKFKPELLRRWVAK